MKKLKLMLAGVIAITLLSGCSQKVPPPAKVKSWDKDSSITINHQLLLDKDLEVPKDDYLQNNNWTYQVKSYYENGKFFKNHEIVKTFLLAHNAKDMVIIGEEEVIGKYKSYFLSNQVTANIKLQPVSYMAKNKNFVNILFFNTKKDSK